MGVDCDALRGISGGRVAQLGERIVRNDEVAGSTPVSSTIFFYHFGDFRDDVQLPRLRNCSRQIEAEPELRLFQPS